MKLVTFFKKGYLIVSKLFNPKEIEEISEAASRLQKTAEELSNTQTGKVMFKGSQFVIDRVENKTQIHRVVWAGASEPLLLKHGRKKELTVIVSQLLESEKADHLINQIHYKIPGDEVKFDWHQDIKNRRFFDPKWKDVNGKGSFVQLITAIDPMTEENGPIKIIGGLPREGDLFLDKLLLYH